LAVAQARARRCGTGGAPEMAERCVGEYGWLDFCPSQPADALLRGCPNLALLATSREPLGIDGERVYRVPSMGTPADGDDPGAIRASEAVRLLEDRAATQGVVLAWDEPAAEVVGRICRLTGFLLSARSFLTYAGGDPAAAARDAAESLRAFRQAGGRLQVGVMLGNLGSVDLSAGDLDAARSHLAEALGILRALNARDAIVYHAFNLGLAEYLGGSLGAAEALFAESLGLARRMGTQRHTAYALIGLALAGRGGTDPGWSARLHGAADQALADLGGSIEPLEQRLADAGRERLRAAMGAAAFEAEYAAGRALTSEESLVLALGEFPARANL